MDMVYKFRAGSRLHGDAQAAGNSLAGIRATRGRLVAPEVVEAARPAESALHPYFEWDDTEAASEYRKEQARHLIAAVVVVRTEAHGDVTPIRAWCKVSGRDGYESVEVVMASPDLRELVLREVKSSIKGLREKIESFEGFASVLTALDEVDAVATMQLEKVQSEHVVTPG